MPSDLARMSLAQVSQLLKSRAVSPVDLVEAVLARIKAGQPRLNAFITVLEDEARAAARKAEGELACGGPKSPLHGVPIALKDLYYTKGIRTTAGSKILAEFVPEFDSTVTERLGTSGAILVGKTNTHEYAYGPSTESSFFGPTRNPWNPEMIPGGSSGGSGAAVAAGMSYMAMGTDTGGSIRIPSCLCGVAGFKPTYGTVSLYGIVPLSSSFDHPGPLARSVADIALTMDVVAGPDQRDRFSRQWDKPFYATILEDSRGLEGVRVGVPVNYFWDKVDYEVEARTRAAIARLAELGAEVIELEVPGAEEVQKVTTVLMSIESLAYHRDQLAVRGDDYQPDVRIRLEKAFEITGLQHYEALRLAEEIRKDVAETLSRVDVLAFPSVPIPAYKINSPTVVTRAKEEPAREMLTRHTRLANLTGGPALSVPCGLTSSGLPCGLQIVGGLCQDVSVLRVGYAYEKANPWEMPV